MKLIGDGVIAEFGSVVDAVNCALSVQRSSITAPDQSASPPIIVLQIGINLGDVIIEGEDIYGDGVNIAARLEPLAEPGGICISSIVNESVGNRIDVRFQDGGDISVKNIDRPIRVWKWHPSATTPTAARSSAAKPQPNVAVASIAVLPFINMSGDPEQEYFSDGISEDIITDLSKIAGLTVIARNSSFTFKGRSVDVRTVGRDLGVRSVLEGSIRRASNRVRITAQLVVQPASVLASKLSSVLRICPLPQALIRHSDVVQCHHRAQHYRSSVLVSDKLGSSDAPRSARYHSGPDTFGHTDAMFWPKLWPDENRFELSIGRSGRI